MRVGITFTSRRRSQGALPPQSPAQLPISCELGKLAGTGLDALVLEPIRPCGAIDCEPIGSPAVPFGSMHGADQSLGRRIEDLLGTVHDNFSRDMRLHDAPNGDELVGA